MAAMLKEKRTHMLTAVLLTIALTGCGGTREDPNPFRSYDKGCRAGSPFPCTDTIVGFTAGGRPTRRITAWDPAKRTLLDMEFVDGRMVAERSFVHRFDSAMRDSLLLWIEGYESDSIRYKGWTSYHYATAGYRSMIVLHNSDGNAYDTLHFYPDGTRREPCFPFAAGPCSERTDSVDSRGREVTLRLSWDPQERTFTQVTTTASGEIVEEESFVHRYNGWSSDSIVYWIASYSHTEGATYSGWGVYHYDKQRALKRIDNYNAVDGKRYGAVYYDSDGGTRECVLVDGYIYRIDARDSVLCRRPAAEKTGRAGCCPEFESPDPMR